MKHIPPTPPVKNDRLQSGAYRMVEPSAAERVPTTSEMAPMDSNLNSAAHANGETTSDASVQMPADRVRYQAELRRSRNRAAVMSTELRTLKERIIILRARAAALEQKVKMQAEDLEKYHHALGGVTEGLRQNQNLTVSFQLHLGQVLVNRGRWLLQEFQVRGLRGRLKLLPRISEFLDFQANVSDAVYSHAEWPDVRSQLEQLRSRKWYRQVLDKRVFKRTLINFASRFRKSA